MVRQLLIQTLKDSGYVEHIGMGVLNTIIMGMQRHNDIEADFIADDLQLSVCLYGKEAQATDSQHV